MTKYKKRALFIVTLFSFVTTTAFVPIVKASEDGPPPWKDGGDVCYQGEGCPSWVCRNVCEKYIVVTCVKPQYVCKWDEKTSQKVCSMQRYYYHCTMCVDTSIRCQAACFLK